jgi:hypothetical protein
MPNTANPDHAEARESIGAARELIRSALATRRCRDDARH